MSDLDKVFDKSNLSRAWKWLQTNPQYQYKNYFRDVYSAYSIASEQNINDLSRRLKTNQYIVSNPIKIYQPKPSGLLRPITLLTVEDQIVFQAFANIVAEYHFKKVKNRYNTITFGHQYSSKSSPFFYKNWIEGYKNFTNSIKKSFKDGFVFSATFDLTACYDSIDHKVLSTFLSNVGLEVEFNRNLIEMLSKWTSDSNIYHGHGIPQGPLSSGILSEVMLSFFDENFEKSKFSSFVKYFRYVDDIHLMAKDEASLRSMLVRLDFFSKQVGLFPQTSKILMHRIINIKEEIKSISSPFNSENNDEIDQNEVVNRILLLTKNNQINDITQFKLALSSALPNHKITAKLFKLFDKYFHLYEPISRYLSKYEKIPNSVYNKLIKFLEKPGIKMYPIISATILFSLVKCSFGINKDKLISYIEDLWKRNGRDHIKDPILRMTLIIWLLIGNKFSYYDIKNIIENEDNWWILKTLPSYLDKIFIGEPSYIDLITLLLKKESIDISITSSHEIIKNNINIKNPAFRNTIAQNTLLTVGLIKKTTTLDNNTIGKMLEFICNKKSFPRINWKLFFRKHYQPAINKIVLSRSYMQSDITAFINILDVFNDLLLHQLFIHDPSLGKYILGKIGSCLNPNSRLQKKYPHLYHLCSVVHEKRLHSDLSHPIHRNTMKSTGRIKHSYLKTLKPILLKGYEELINSQYQYSLKNLSKPASP